MAEACSDLRKTAVMSVVLQLLVDSTGNSGYIAHYKLSEQLRRKHVLNGVLLILDLRFSLWLLKNTAFWDVMPVACFLLVSCLAYFPTQELVVIYSSKA